jgi:hypothetical protein
VSQSKALVVCIPSYSVFVVTFRTTAMLKQRGNGSNDGHHRQHQAVDEEEKKLRLGGSTKTFAVLTVATSLCLFILWIGVGSKQWTKSSLSLEDVNGPPPDSGVGSKQWTTSSLSLKDVNGPPPDIGVGSKQWTTSSSSLVEDVNGFPADLVVHGKRKKYTPVPSPELTRVVMFAGNSRFSRGVVSRPFLFKGWQATKNISETHIFYQKSKPKNNNFFTKLQPWQRYSRVPGSYESFSSKDGFIDGFRRYAARNDDNAKLWFLPETYRLREETDRVDFQRRLDQGGKNYPWVLKKVNVHMGLGVEMLGPNSKELETALQRTKDDPKTTYIVQSYICNELTWFHGQKFDLRMFFLVASVDPLIALYQDGYARVSPTYTARGTLAQRRNT